MQVSELNGGHTRSFSAGPSFSGPRQLGARCGSPWILGGGGGVQTSRWLEGRACEPPLWPWWGRGCACLLVTLTTGAEPSGAGFRAPWGGPGQAPLCLPERLRECGPPRPLTAALLLQNTLCLALDPPSWDLESKQSQTSHGF